MTATARRAHEPHDERPLSPIPAPICWQLTLVLLLLVPLSLSITMRQRKRMNDANVAVKRRQAEINTVIESGISGVRTAKAFTNEGPSSARSSRLQRPLQAQQDRLVPRHGRVSGRDGVHDVGHAGRGHRARRRVHHARADRLRRPHHILACT
ncbi:MAG: ABC transporter transmembrane domain-containing protein [Oscillospiraceae bacterium]